MSTLSFKTLGLVVLTTILLSSKLFAEPVPLSEYFIEHWTDQHGLPHNSVNSIRQTPDGYLWFATWEGVVRFNGREFTRFGSDTVDTLNDSGIRALTVTPEGELLAAGSRGAFSRYSDNQWQPMPHIDARINYILQDRQQNIWLATNSQGLFRIDSDNKIRHFTTSEGLPTLTIETLHEDNLGNLWVGTASGLVRVSRNMLTLIRDIPAVPVISIAEDQSGKLVIGAEAGLYRGQGDTFSAFYPDILNNGISQLMADDQGALWVGTARGELFRITEQNIDQVGPKQGLPDSRIKALYQDNEKSLWIGTNSGLVRLRTANFSTISTQQGLPSDYVRSVLSTHDGSILAGTSHGLARIQGNQAEPVPLPLAETALPSILSLAQQGDNILIGTHQHGLLLLGPDNQLQQFSVAQGLPSNQVRAVIQQENGTIWAGTAQGLSRISSQGTRHYNQSNGLLDDYVMALAQDPSGNIWIGTESGAAIYMQGTIQTLTLDHLDNTRSVYGFYAGKDGEYMWLATDRGLVRYRYHDQSLSMIGLQQGFPIQKLFQVVEDNKQNLWLTSNMGIVRMPLQQAHGIADGIIEKADVRVFSSGEGMLSHQANGTSGPAVTKDQSGNILIATAKGVARVNPDHIKELSDFSVPVVLERLEVDGQALPVTNSLELPADTRRIQFRFAGLGYILPDAIEYHTRLEGFDSNWVARGNVPVAEYTNLSPGKYQFQVKASYPGAEQTTNHPMLNVKMRVTPYFWQRTEVIASAILLALLMLIAFVRAREHVLRAHARELREQVQVQTQEIQQQARLFEQQAMQDPLTGLANRRSFDNYLKQLSHNPTQYTGYFLAIIDIDNFKLVNDRWSHDVGDRAIHAVASVIAHNCREGDHAARWGGEEFSLVMPGVDVHKASEICERIRQQIQAADYSHLGFGLTLTVSIGLSGSVALDDYRRLLIEADKALYHAKSSGRNSVRIWKSPPTPTPIGSKSA
ncbi:ligand-binding sensor domain-containing diguanylate cyclase [Lacimicrobium alkaliphilum]|uniref:diguanylate cyclase n=1 Tax=Lacimicrobium alkaliphilum TaxID=1526571 RepID=A0ABQ1QYU2_9ALTE|nr:ligand-binding sensor domain-containing diguanylate cyclase [Lacimicrobium alkaliphilum]GGD48998.1 GGDEF domain-containing protein [Lacimicrobium alkaliphilum]